MRKSFVLSILLSGFTAFGAFGEIKTAKTEFDPLATNTVTQTVDLTGELLQLGIRSGSTNAFDLTISDFTTGTTIYSATNLTATSYNFAPLIAATDSAGATVTNTLGTVYITSYVKKVKITAGNSRTTNDTLTVYTLINDDP